MFRNSGHKERKGIKVFIVGGAKENPTRNEKYKIDGSISIDRMSGRGVDSLGSQVVKSDYKIVPDCP